jgi:hypothetical protein
MTVTMWSDEDVSFSGCAVNRCVTLVSFMGTSDRSLIDECPSMNAFMTLNV